MEFKALEQLISETASQKGIKQNEDTALERTKLELDNNTDLPGGLDA